ncbi:MAG TPA: hypothetical protein VKB80_31960 [Kofleriaceae bacterium]|nr:hypothetical protein [Kofleriaceae bacterium]
MRLVKSPLFILLACGALSLAACGGGGDDDDTSGDQGGNTDDGSSSDDGAADDGGDAATVNPDGVDNTYVIDSVVVPANANEAQDVALDIDGNGTKDNKLGGLLGSLSSFVGDIQSLVEEQVAKGGIILLANVKATDLTAASGVGLYVYLGANPNPAPCATPDDTECGLHLQGDGSFDIDPSSPTDAVVVGATAGGKFTGGPGSVTIQLSLSELADPLSLTLSNAKSEVSVSADGLSDGILGGALTIDSINNDLLPAVATVIAGILADDGCDATATPCCEPGSTGEQILQVLDEGGVADGDCVITAEELANNSFVSATLGSPDVDLDGDGTDDAVSLGIGFSAVTGTFTPPAP